MSQPPRPGRPPPPAPGDWDATTGAAQATQRTQGRVKWGARGSLQLGCEEVCEGWDSHGHGESWEWEPWPGDARLAGIGAGCSPVVCVTCACAWYRAVVRGVAVVDASCSGPWGGRARRAGAGGATTTSRSHERESHTDWARHSPAIGPPRSPCPGGSRGRRGSWGGPAWGAGWSGCQGPGGREAGGSGAAGSRGRRAARHGRGTWKKTSPTTRSTSGRQRGGAWGAAGSCPDGVQARGPRSEARAA